MIEAYASSLTKPALTALERELELNKLETKGFLLKEETADLIEHLLITSSLATHSSAELTNILLNLLKNHKQIPITDIKEKIVLTLGSLIHLELTKTPTRNENLIDEAIGKIIDSNHNLKSSSLPESKLAYMEALKNSHHSKCFDYMIQQFEHLQSSPPLAMSALNFIDNSRESLADSVLAKLLVIFYNKKNSDESRLEALAVSLNRFEHLLIEKDSPILENILRSLFKAKSKEFLFYGQQLLKNKINSNNKFRFFLFGNIIWILCIQIWQN